jgi:cerevisin
LVGAGIHVVVAAGNDNIDVINEIPARFLAPITVGASDIQDRRWADSNWGPGIDIFAPGAQIRSAGINQEDLTVR